MLVNRANLNTLHVSFNAAFMKGFGSATNDHDVFTFKVASTTKEEEYGWLGEDESLREWVGERAIRSIRDHGYSIRNRKFERTVGVPRDVIEDDLHGLYSTRFERMGMSAARHPCELAFEALKGGFENKCFDGQYFFDGDHPVAGGTQSNTGGGAGNPWFLVDSMALLSPIIFQTRRDYEFTTLDNPTDENVFMRDEYLYGVSARVAAGYGIWQTAYGSKQDLTADNYKAAREAMLAFKNDAGKPMGCKPTHLICGPGHEHEALEILNAERLASGATNVYKGTAEPVVTPWLAA